MLNKRIFVFIKSISLSLLAFHCFSANASENNGELDGFYVPVKGGAQSQELNPGNPVTGEQLGRFKIILKRKGWNSLSNFEKDRILEKIEISGVFHGLVQDPFGLEGSPVVEHKFSNKDRDGSLFSWNDEVTIMGAEPCALAPNAVILNVQETLMIERGTGIYQNLQYGKIGLVGTVDLCSSQNDFVVQAKEEGLCFGAHADCE